MPYALWVASPELKEFQAKLLFCGGFAVLSAAFVVIFFCVGRYTLFGATAQASVIYVEQTGYNAGPTPLPNSEVEYQYFDDQAQVVRTENYYRYHSPAPVVGETFAVEYLPNHDHSAIVLDGQPMWLMWLTLPAIALFFWLASMCVRQAMRND